MTPHELDDVIFRLGEVFDVYEKKLNQGAVKSWQRLFSGRNKGDCLKALDDHLLSEKFAPKPCNIEDRLTTLEVMRGDRKLPTSLSDSFETKRALELEERSTGLVSTPRIVTAWQILSLLRFGHGLSAFTDGRHNNLDMSKDEALEICNEQAAKFNIPEAIPKDFRIDSFWT